MRSPSRSNRNLQGGHIFLQDEIVMDLPQESVRKPQFQQFYTYISDSPVQVLLQIRNNFIVIETGQSETSLRLTQSNLLDQVIR